MCSVTFHVIAITCVVWSLYVLIDRTADEIKQGQRRLSHTHTHAQMHFDVNAAVCVGCRPFVHTLPAVSKSFIGGVK